MNGCNLLRDRVRALQLAAVSVTAIALVIACGGSGGSEPERPECVASLAAQNDGAGGGTDGPGPGDGTGAGDGGPGLGQFRHALITLEQADGRVLGPVEADDTTGLVKFVLCGYTGPVKFTVTGKANTTYFDEGANAEVAFPTDARIRAIIPRFTRNVGFTMLTEAAYQYVETKYGVDGWKDAGRVTEGNTAVKDAFNRVLPEGMLIDDITRLPPLLNAQSGSNALGATPNGLLGTINVGLARASRFFNLADPKPALSLAQQLGQDLSDGKIDGFWIDRSSGAPVARPVVADSSQSTYTYAQFAEFLNNGVGQATSTWGQANQNSVLKVTQIKVAQTPLQAWFTITSRSAMFILRSDGNVYYWPRPDRPLRLYARNFRQLYPQSSMLGSTHDGAVYFQPTLSTSTPDLPANQRIYDIVGPLVEANQYRGATTIGSTPDSGGLCFAQGTRLQDGVAYRDTGTFTSQGSLQSTGLASVTMIDTGCFASPFYIALQSNGNVFAWGNGGGNGILLGLGMLQNGNVALPTLNPNLREVVSIAARTDGGFAMDRAGKVWGWGVGPSPTGLVPRTFSPIEVKELSAFGPIVQIACGTDIQCIALTGAGEIVAWGYFSNIEGSVSERTLFPPTRITIPAGRRAIYIGAMHFSVYALLDDATVVTFPTHPTVPMLLRPADAPVVP